MVVVGHRTVHRHARTGMVHHRTAWTAEAAARTAEAAVVRAREQCSCRKRDAKN